MKAVDMEKVLEFVNKEFRYCSGYPNCGEGDYMYECAVTDARNKITTFLKAQPTVEAAPVVHGKWIVGKHGDFKCCVCGRDNVEQIENYCPQCAAKMDL